MTSKKEDKQFCSAVSNYIYGLLEKDLSAPADQRQIFHSSIAEIRFVVPFPSFVEARHPEIIVISKDAIQDIIVQQNCISKIGFVLYKCQQHQLIEVTKAVLHDDADPSACVVVIDDSHSSLTPFEHFASFSQQFRSVQHLVRRAEVFRETCFDEEPFGRSGRIIGVFFQASDHSKVVNIRWKFETNSETWLASNNVLLPGVIKQILALPGVQRIRILKRPPFFTTMSTTDRSCIQICLKHENVLTQELIRNTLHPMRLIALKLFAQEGIEFQRKCVFLQPGPGSVSTFDAAVKNHKVCAFSVETLDESQILVLSAVLKELQLFFYILPRKTLFVYETGAALEALRIKCIEKNLIIPLGRKQGGLQLKYEGCLGDSRDGRLIREAIGEITREAVQICNRPGLLDEQGRACQTVLDFLGKNFSADNFSRQFVKSDDSQVIAVLAFDIPTTFADRLPISCTISTEEPFVIQHMLPVMKPERFVSIVHPAEDKTDAFLNSFMHPNKRQFKVSSIAALPGNSGSWARFQTVAPHLFIKDNDCTIPCTTADEVFPWIFVSSPLSSDDFEAVSTYFAHEQLYFQHHSWIPSLLSLPQESCLSKTEAGPGAYHIRLHSWKAALLNQPRLESGRVVIGRSNPLRVLVYEHSDMIVYVPIGGMLLNLFADPECFYILRHRAISCHNLHLDSLFHQKATIQESQIVASPWIRDDFFKYSSKPKSDKEITPLGPTQLDSEMTDSIVPEVHTSLPRPQPDIPDVVMKPATIAAPPLTPNDATNAPAKGEETSSRTNAIVPLVLSSSSPTALPKEPSNGKASDKEKHRRVLLKILEVKDFISKDPDLAALKCTENDIERAANFLLHLPEVSCFYVAATRILGKAAWTKEHQLNDKDLQSLVLKEIAKGWTLAAGRKNSKFTRHHLALALGAYTSLNPFTIDSFQDALINIFDHMIPQYHEVFCARVKQICSTCSTTHEWYTPFFDSTIKKYDDITASMMPEIFLQCLPTREGFPGTAECCTSNFCPIIMQEASIKVVSLQFFQCALPNVSCHTNILKSEPFTIEDVAWKACAVVVHSVPNHFYLIERSDKEAKNQPILFVKHDNAVGFQRGCEHIKSTDTIAAIVFRKSECKPLWLNSGIVRKSKKKADAKDGGADDKDSATKAKRTPVTSKAKAELTEHQAKIRGIRQIIIKKGRISSQAMKLSPSKCQKRTISLFDEKKQLSQPRQSGLFLTQVPPVSGVCIHIPDSDEEAALKRTNIAESDPISQFESPQNQDFAKMSTHHASQRDQSKSPDPIASITPSVAGPPESDKQSQQPRGEPLGSSPHQKTQQIPYALISLFDGCGSTYHIFREAVGYPPQVFLAAEWDPQLRAIVADALGLAIDETWHYNRFQSKSLYISNVDSLFSNEAAIIKQFLSLLPANCRIFVIGGSPCTELTVGGTDQGLLGLTGPASCLFFNIHLLLFLLQTVIPKEHIRFLIENAGSMLPIHSKFIRWALGISATPIESFVWDSNILGLADRKRFFFQNVVSERHQLAPTPQPFPPGWGPLPFFEGNKLKYVTAKVFMRPREEVNDGFVHRSWSAYHPYSLVWNYDYFGTVRALADMTRLTSHNTIPQLDWSAFIPELFLTAWKSFLRTIFDSRSTFLAKDNAIRAVSPLFHNPRVQLPFRLITAKEAAIMSGIQPSLELATRLPYLQTDFIVLSAVGNSFHPALISAALGTTADIQKWLSGQISSTLEVVSPQQVVQEFASYSREIDNMTRGKKILKEPVRTPYRSICTDISLSRLCKPPVVLPLQILPTIPRELQKPAMDEKIQALRRVRMRMIDPEVAQLLTQSGFADVVDDWYAPMYFPLSESTSCIMGKRVGDPTHAQVRKHRASQSVQSLTSFEAFVMCMWSLFSGREGENNRTSVAAVFRATAGCKPRVLLFHGASPKDLYVVVQQPERLEVALAVVHNSALTFESISAAPDSNIDVQRVPIVAAAHFHENDVEGFVIPMDNSSVVGASPSGSGCVMTGCPLFHALCLYKLILYRADEVVPSLQCHALVREIPLVFAFANVMQGNISIGRPFHRNQFDWSCFRTMHSPPPVLVCLIFVDQPQEATIGQIFVRSPAVEYKINSNMDSLITWSTLSCPKHQCGYGNVGAVGAIVARNTLSGWVSTML